MYENQRLPLLNWQAAFEQKRSTFERETTEDQNVREHLTVRARPAATPCRFPPLIRSPSVNDSASVSTNGRIRPNLRELPSVLPPGDSETLGTLRSLWGDLLAHLDYAGVRHAEVRSDINELKVATRDGLNCLDAKIVTLATCVGERPEEMGARTLCEEVADLGMGAGTTADSERKLKALFDAKERELLEKCQEAAEAMVTRLINDLLVADPNQSTATGNVSQGDTARIKGLIQDHAERLIDDRVQTILFGSDSEVSTMVMQPIVKFLKTYSSKPSKPAGKLVRRVKDMETVLEINRDGSSERLETLERQRQQIVDVRQAMARPPLDANGGALDLFPAALNLDSLEPSQWSTLLTWFRPGRSTGTRAGAASGEREPAREASGGSPRRSKAKREAPGQLSLDLFGP